MDLVPLILVLLSFIAFCCVAYFAVAIFVFVRIFKTLKPKKRDPLDTFRRL